jgi:hypothetical protein
MKPKLHSSISHINRAVEFFDQKWASYALAGGAALFGAGAANAAIITSNPGVNLFAVDGTAATQRWDVDGDGTDDFNWVAAAWSKSYTAIDSLSNNSATSALGMALTISNGTMIDSLTGWPLELAYFHQERDVTGGKKNKVVGTEIIGNWPNDLTQSAYVGLRFEINGNKHYGWARVSSEIGSASLAVTQAAYESTPGAGIAAGDTGELNSVPEPSSMALMLLGAAGIAALKRRRASGK